MIIINEDLKPGLSGIMRVKNDAEFITSAIASCIDSLDELIIVYNDCNDNSPEIIEQNRSRYPHKIRVYEYPYHVYSTHLSEEEFNYALHLDDTSPNLLCNYYNFALSKVSYSHAMKIDADQVYFSEVIDYWRTICIRGYSNYRLYDLFVGFLIDKYIRFTRMLCVKMHRFIDWFPYSFVKYARKPYLSYVSYEFAKGKASISLSGLNIVYAHGEYKVPMGWKYEIINVLPPYNGECDHLIFQVTNDTYYKKCISPYYNELSNSSYSIIEEFVCPVNPKLVGFGWIHLNALRSNTKKKLTQVERVHPEWFIPVKQFMSLRYSDILHFGGNTLFSLYQRVLFSWIHKLDKGRLFEHVNTLLSYDQFQE